MTIPDWVSYDWCCGCERYRADFRGIHTSAKGWLPPRWLPFDFAKSFDVVAGEWSIEDGRLVTEDSEALVLCRRRYFDRAAIITALWHAQTGDEVRVIGNYQDPANYHYYQARHGDPDDHFIRWELWERRDGSDTLLGFPAYDSDRIFPPFGGPSYIQRIAASDVFEAIGSIVIDPDYISAGFRDSSANIRTAIGEQVFDDRYGQVAGIGTGTVAGRVEFTEFELYRRGVKEATCPDRYFTSHYTTCLGLPDTLQADLAGIANKNCPQCTQFNGTYLLTGPHRYGLSWIYYLPWAVCGYEYLKGEIARAYIQGELGPSTGNPTIWHLLDNYWQARDCLALDVTLPPFGTWGWPWACEITQSTMRLRAI